MLSRLHNILGQHFTRIIFVYSLGTDNWQGIHWCWQTGVLGSLWLLVLLFGLKAQIRTVTISLHNNENLTTQEGRLISFGVKAQLRTMKINLLDNGNLATEVDGSGRLKSLGLKVQSRTTTISLCDNKNLTTYGDGLGRFLNFCDRYNC